MVQEIQNFGTVMYLNVVHGMEILVVINWDCGFGQVCLKESFYGLEGFYDALWMLYFATRLFEDQETEQGNPAGLERGEWSSRVKIREIHLQNYQEYRLEYKNIKVSAWHWRE